MKKVCALVFTITIAFKCFGQDEVNHNPKDYVLSTQKTTEKIMVDGKLDEDVWKTNTSTATDFWMKFPSNNTKAPQKTEVKTCFDNEFLYIAATLYDSSNTFSVTSLKRDQGLRSGDGFGIVLDPFNQKTNGFLFVVSPYNTQSEDVYSNSNYDIDFSWDNKWFSQTKIYNGYWTVEIAIPFNILRYDANKLKWGINFLRSDRKKNEFNSWTKMPLQFRGLDLGYLGELNWQTSPPKTGTNISINPYALTQGYKASNKDAEFKANTGFDAKVAVTPSLNLDLTVNPDFSQVDVDRQVTNLTRFNIFFPERRSFFLENSDLFSSYGIEPIRPFYSRRIGSKNGIAVPILFGARLSGNVAKKTRIGLMNMTTSKKENESGDNFTAVSINQQVLKRSSFNAYFFNRQDLDNATTKVAPTEKYGRNGGLQFVFTDQSGKWNGWADYNFSIKPTYSSLNSFTNLGGEYQGRNLNAVLAVNTVGENYFTDMGFSSLTENYDAARDTVIRIGTKILFNNLKYTWFGNKKVKWNTISTELENVYLFTFEGKGYEFSNQFTFKYNTKKSSGVEFIVEKKKSFLPFPYKFVDDASALPIPAATYDYTTFGVKYNTDIRKDKSFTIGIKAGKFYNADFLRIGGNIAIRKQPKYSILINAEFNNLVFAKLYGSQSIFLIAPQVEYNFSNKLFWTTFFQLNSQNNNININSRLQYRYRPMSDLFIVYTDNYYSDPIFNNKNRALVVKLNYWLNL